MSFLVSVRAVLAAGQGRDGWRLRGLVCSPALCLLNRRNSAFVRKCGGLHTHGSPHLFTKSTVLGNDCYAYLTFQTRAGFHTQPSLREGVRWENWV